MYPALSCLQNTVKQFSVHTVTILQEAMRWAPHSTQSHLIEYLVKLGSMSGHLGQHSGLALATEGVLNFAGYNSQSAALPVSKHPTSIIVLRG